MLACCKRDTTLLTLKVVQRGVTGVVPGLETILSNGRFKECGPKQHFRERTGRWVGVIPECIQC